MKANRFIQWIFGFVLIAGLIFSPIAPQFSGDIGQQIAWAGKTAYQKVLLTGGGATALDGIDGDDLLDGDFAYVMASSVLYVYILDDDSAAAESSPLVIAPDTNPGDKRWILQILPVSGGGSGVTTFTDGGILVGAGTGAVEAVAVGTTTEILVGGGAGTNPVWTTATGSGAPVRATSPTLVTPVLGTPASGTLTSCTGLPVSTGISGMGAGVTTFLATPSSANLAAAVTDETGSGSAVFATSPVLTTPTRTASPSDNDSSLAIATTAFAKAEDAVIVNPKAFAQGINMTAAASGSNGIQVADDNNIDFGTGNFTLVWRGSLPDWTPSATQYLIVKEDGFNGFIFRVHTTEALGLDITNLGTFYSTVGTTAIDGSTHAIAISVIRESAGATGTATFYLDGIQLGNAVVLPQASPVSVTNNINFYLLGTDAVRYAGTVHSAATYSRALTAAEVLALYRNGIDFADKWGSQTELMPNQVDRDFSGANAWADVDLVAGGGAYDETTDLTITAGAAGAGDYCTLAVASAPTTIGKRYRMTYDLANLVGTWTLKDFTGAQTIGTISANATQAKIEWVADTTGGYRLVAVSNDASGDFDNFTLTKIGATLALEGEGAQPAPGQWLDSSGNKLHAMQPATGSTLIRPKRDFEIRWTNTWAGTHEAQYIGGVNQAVLPVNCYITSIIGVVAGATIEDIIVGDGSDTDHWVAVTTGLAAGTTAFTIANAISDATNYKLVVDPDANMTGSIAWTVRGIIL